MRLCFFLIFWFSCGCFWWFLHNFLGCVLAASCVTKSRGKSPNVGKSHRTVLVSGRFGYVIFSIGSLFKVGIRGFSQLKSCGEPAPMHNNYLSSEGALRFLFCCVSVWVQSCSHHNQPPQFLLMPCLSACSYCPSECAIILLLGHGGEPERSVACWFCFGLNRFFIYPL